ncbi:hypothetical protein [Ammoniphilus sp. 3BR4]|uniref:hypothetical protein n=1 Tax=Ammoniphilus sp. 3BR4 TaxID=3158265 RepID=UPI003466FDBF
MLKKGMKWALAAALLSVPIGCGAGPEIQQERQEEMIDEHEDEQLNNPVTEYRQEQIEDRYDDRE